MASANSTEQEEEKNQSREFTLYLEQVKSLSIKETLTNISD